MKKNMDFFGQIPMAALVGVGILTIGAIFLVGTAIWGTGNLFSTSLVSESSSTKLQEIKIEPSEATLAPGQEQEFQAYGVFSTGEVSLRVQWSLDPENLGKLNCGSYTSSCVFTAGNEVSEGEVGIKYGSLTDEADITILQAEEQLYPDVKPEDWFYNSVMQASTLNLMGGKEDGYFYPGDFGTRADFLLVNYRFLGLLGVEIPDNLEKSDCGTFSDVPASHYAATAICAFSGMGWIKGVSDGVFGPDLTVTREQASKILYLSLEKEWGNVSEDSQVPDFSDVPPGHWSHDYVMALARRYILKGKGEGKFDPTGNINRAEMTAMFVRSIDALK